QGPCVLLLHGFMEDHTIWKTLVPLLEKNFRVITPDLHGHSKSETAGPVHTMEKMAAAMWNVLSAEGIRETIITGHSLGGYVALEMARMEPTRVKGVCMLHSTALPDSDIKKKERDRVIKVMEMSPAVFIREAIPNLFAEDLKKIFQHEINELTERALQHNTDGLIATTRGMRDRSDGLEWLKKQKIPFHYIIGKKDPVIPFDMYAQQLTAGKHVSSFISEKSGHMGFIEDTAAILNSIVSFIKKYTPETI
ncbi:MAG: alpha/beta fold hydrolase, partial [Flavobacteriales bacterium]